LPDASRFPGFTTSIDELEEAGLEEGERLSVIASTSILGDVVSQIGGDAIHLATLMPPDADPHTYEPNPADVQALATADAIFIVGAGLEESMMPALASLEAGAPIIPLSSVSGLPESGGGLDSSETQAEHEVDPHQWMDPYYVMEWSNIIEGALSALDPVHAPEYRANRARYLTELNELHAWIEREVAPLPAGHRHLITDHISLTHFGARYGFETGNSVIPSYSTSSEPSAKDLARLQDFIRDHQVPAIFFDISNPSPLLDQVAEDLRVSALPLYIGTLSEAAGPASSYLDLMRFDVAQIVSGLR
jgi:ABC-type Zn uptake system ZnuABC Zn-binding protein ZnuA